MYSLKISISVIICMVSLLVHTRICQLWEKTNEMFVFFCFDFENCLMFYVLNLSSFTLGYLLVRESDGSFQLGNYGSEVDDLHAVVEYFNVIGRAVRSIIGHSKGHPSPPKYTHIYIFDEETKRTSSQTTGLSSVFVCLYFVLSGGDVVLLYASKYKNVNIVINVCGRYDMTKGIEKSLGENYQEEMDKKGFVDIKNPTGICYFDLKSFTLIT